MLFFILNSTRSLNLILTISSILRRSATTVDSFIARKNSNGHVYGTSSGSSPTDVWGYYLVSFKLKVCNKLISSASIRLSLGTHRAF